jgi:mono/diheme cytochrome c family protein
MATLRARGVSAFRLRPTRLLTLLLVAPMACSGEVNKPDNAATPPSTPPSETPQLPEVMNPPSTPPTTPPSNTPNPPLAPSTPAEPGPVTPTEPEPTPPIIPTTPIGPVLPAPTVRVSEIELPSGVRTILERRCISCHTYGERDPAGWGSALDLSRMIDSDIVVPGNPDASRLYNRVAVRADMPYNGARLASAEVQVLRAWIANLNRPAPPTPRSHRAMLDLLAADQNAATQRALGDDLRYLSFAHFAEERRAPEEIAAAEQVLALTLNSLSRRAAMVKLEAVDAGRTIFRFRLSALGWSGDEWDDLVSFYPYCLRSDQASHRTLYTRLGTESPYLRADWFLATATRPPLYERLLEIPQTLDELADDLNVDIRRNINHPGQTRPTNLARIGFRSSGVSANNRIIDRHARTNGGYMWVSYDFGSSEDRSDIRENPLGPDALDDRNFEHTFQQAGGEIIWSLPNGLQAYMLVDAAGQRIDLAPKEIVRDPRRPGGAVENGVSCISCHGVTGMNYPRAYDEIVKYAEEHRNEYSSQELNEVRALYPTTGAMILTADADRYLKAKDLTGAGRAGNGVVEYDDFINLVGQYEGEVGLRGAALELGIGVDAARTLVSTGRNEDALPLTLADPLVSRVDFMCQFRALVTRAVSGAGQCSGAFDAPEMVALCQ